MTLLAIRCHHCHRENWAEGFGNQIQGPYGAAWVCDDCVDHIETCVGPCELNYHKRDLVPTWEGFVCWGCLEAQE